MKGLSGDHQTRWICLRGQVFSRADAILDIGTAAVVDSLGSHAFARLNPDDAPLGQDESELSSRNAGARTDISRQPGHTTVIERYSQSCPKRFGILGTSAAVSASKLVECLLTVTH